MRDRARASGREMEERQGSWRNPRLSPSVRAMKAAARRVGSLGSMAPAPRAVLLGKSRSRAKKELKEPLRDVGDLKVMKRGMQN